VVDASGKPVRSARVHLLSRRLTDSGITLALEEHSAVTDDRGHYRLYDLAPGRYTVAVLPKTDPTATAFAHTFFPGTVDPEAAELFSIDPGETRSNTNFFLVSTPYVERLWHQLPERSTKRR